jgi:hypothetical protein
VKFVDTDLSIQPSHHGVVDGDPEPNERGADKYYKDMQSIHGDTVLPSGHTLLGSLSVPANSSSFLDGPSGRPQLCDDAVHFSEPAS